MSDFYLRDDSEWVLHVDSSTLKGDYFESIIDSAQTPAFTWEVVLEDLYDDLIVSVRIKNNDNQYNGLFRAIHIVPRHSPEVLSKVFPKMTKLLSGEWIKFVIGIDNVLYNNKYLFDVVLTTSEKLSRNRIEAINQDRPSETAIRNSKFMETLLKDPYSVDIRFVFDADKSYSNVGLWAHRSILAEYKPLADLIQEASSESATQTSLGNDAQGVINAEMLTIPLSDISPGTLCVLLRYIYTGEINRTVDTSLHAISTTESALVTKGIAGRPARFVRWSPMDKDSPWRLRDVTWEELLRASSRFGLSELQQRCEDAVIASIDANNAVEVLFTIGSAFDYVKDSAMAFIAERIESVLLEDKEAFAAYKDHPNAFDFLVELLRRKAPKAAATVAA